MGYALSPRAEQRNLSGAVRDSFQETRSPRLFTPEPDAPELPVNDIIASVTPEFSGGAKEPGILNARASDVFDHRLRQPLGHSLWSAMRSVSGVCFPILRR
jgi:hypothetical protein